MIPAGAKRLGPGVYAHRGELHIEAVELLEANGIPATDANQDALERAARAHFHGDVRAVDNPPGGPRYG